MLCSIGAISVSNGDDLLNPHVDWNLEFKPSQLNVKFQISKCLCCIKRFINNVAHCSTQ
jgi:hypothetical protein